MPITVQGPDGAEIEFPDGTSPDVIKTAMAKHYGAPQKPQPVQRANLTPREQAKQALATPYTTAPMLPGERELRGFGAGLETAALGGGELLLQRIAALEPGNKRAQSRADEMSRFITEREKKMGETREARGEIGLDVSEIAGQLAFPLKVPGLQGGGLIKGGVKAAIKAAAETAATTPVGESKDFWSEKLHQAETAAGFAGIMHLGGAKLSAQAKAALAKRAKDLEAKAKAGVDIKGDLTQLAEQFADPEHLAKARRLQARGIEITPGMLGGGFMRTMEEFASSSPFLKGAYMKLQADAMKSFNQAVQGEVLSDLGVKVDKNWPVGRKGFAKVKSVLDQGYDKVKSKIKFEQSPEFGQDLKGILATVHEPGEKRTVANIMKDEIAPLMKVYGGKLDGARFKELESKITAIADRYRDMHRVSSAIDEINGALRDQMVRSSPPEVRAELSALNKSYAKFVRYRAASLARKGSEGVITPRDLLGAIKTQARGTVGQNSFASGDALMQGFAQDAEDVLPLKEANSTTTDRAAMMQALKAAGAAGGGIAGLGLLHPGAMIAGAGTFGTILGANALAYNLLKRGVSLPSGGGNALLNAGARTGAAVQQAAVPAGRIAAMPQQ